MANLEHLSVVRAGRDAVSAWRAHNPAMWLDLSGANLSGADLYDANLDEADLRNADLTGADLSGANLRQATLSHANLTRANLSAAILFEASLRGANLSQANLSGATLRRATLIDATLSHANLVYANLSEAKLSGANLSNAFVLSVNLTGASVRGTRLWQARAGDTGFCSLDLSNALGLETVVHDARSTVGTDTLAKSRGKIPQEFLRGCGLLDWEITAAKLYDPEFTDLQQILDYTYRIFQQRADAPVQLYSAFISHSHADKPFARRLHDALQVHGVRCWLDERQVLPGDNIRDRVIEGVRLWDKTLLVCSKDSLNSPWVDEEIEAALQKEHTLWRERNEKVLALIPLNLDGYALTGWTSGKAPTVKSRLAADFTDLESDPVKFDREVERLIRALRADGAGREPPPPPRL